MTNTNQLLLTFLFYPEPINLQEVSINPQNDSPKRPQTGSVLRIFYSLRMNTKMEIVKWARSLFHLSSQNR